MRSEKSVMEQQNKEQSFQALLNEREKEILSQFSEEERKEIKYKQRLLSSLAYFVGKDYEIPVELNEPGEGWHWNFKENKIRIDPKDLLEKPMDYLRFVICHEGGHRRVSRTEFIPLDTWKQPGFSFMMNAIEDPRDNNFVAENYPKFREQMESAYQHDLDIEQKAKEKAAKKLGYQPKFMQAGFEYIKQWYKETQGEENIISEDLPEDVKETVAKTLESAKDSWWRYPSKQEADESEELIKKYAQVSYEINLEEIWPEFQKLVDRDMEDQKMQELMRDMQQEKAEGGESLPQKIKDKLTPEEQEELEKAIEEALANKKAEKQKAEKKGEEEKGEKVESGQEKGEEGEKGEGAPVSINIDSLSDKLKQKIKDHLDSLPEGKRQELKEKAEKSLGDFGKDISDELEGKLADNPEKKAKREAEGKAEDKPKREKSKTKKEFEPQEEEEEKKQRERLKETRRRMEGVFESQDDPYMKTLREIAPLIDDLTGDLRNIFIKRKIGKPEAGYRFGRKWNVKKRIQERIAGIPLIRTESRERTERKSEEKDYAITLLNDLSGSMSGSKIKEDFKSKVVISETLASLNIKFEILGFQDKVLEFKKFDQEFNDDTRQKLNQLPLEVKDANPGGNNNARDNDDGKCLMDASKSLGRRIEANKFLIVLSDGLPETSGKTSSQLNRELRQTVEHISQNTNQKLVGVGLLSDAVSKFYPNNIPDVTTEDLVETLGEVIREIIGR